jgi:hypothetical protein
MSLENSTAMMAIMAKDNRSFASGYRPTLLELAGGFGGLLIKRP